MAHLMQVYVEAVDVCVRALRFMLIEETPMVAGKRWVRVGMTGAVTVSRYHRPSWKVISCA